VKGKGEERDVEREVKGKGEERDVEKQTTTNKQTAKATQEKVLEVQCQVSCPGTAGCRLHPLPVCPHVLHRGWCCQ